MSAKLYSEILREDSITASTKQEMFQLFKDCFSVKQENFLNDLKDKQWVILLRESESNKLAGFTSLKIFDFVFKGESMIVVYDGDTIIAPEFWGTTMLSKTWIKTVLEITQSDSRPVYWMLITSGFRTYRFLPVFYKEFYPCHEHQTPPQKQALMDALAEYLFGDEYLNDLGVVRFSGGATPLVKELAEVDDGRLDDPHIEFYIHSNPGHIHGDELVCLTQIGGDNYTPAGRRMLR